MRQWIMGFVGTIIIVACIAVIATALRGPLPSPNTRTGVNPTSLVTAAQIQQVTGWNVKLQGCSAASEPSAMRVCTFGNGHAWIIVATWVDNDQRSAYHALREHQRNLAGVYSAFSPRLGMGADSAFYAVVAGSPPTIVLTKDRVVLEVVSGTVPGQKALGVSALEQIGGVAVAGLASRFG